MAQQRVLEASDIVPGDDLIAIGKKVAKRRDGEQYQEFAMTLEELFKLGLNGYSVVQQQGVALPSRTILNFEGDGVTVTDNGTETLVTIPGPAVQPKVYLANLTQAGGAAPVPVIGENTLSGIPSPSYATNGSYLLTLNGEFINGKTFVFISGSRNGNVEAFRLDDDTIRINTYVGGLGTDSVLTAPTAIKIIVYP